MLTKFRMLTKTFQVILPPLHRDLCHTWQSNEGAINVNSACLQPEDLVIWSLNPILGRGAERDWLSAPSSMVHPRFSCSFDHKTTSSTRAYMADFRLTSRLTEPLQGYKYCPLSSNLFQSFIFDSDSRSHSASSPDRISTSHFDLSIHTSLY